jgi:hypothetical protein
MNRRQWLLLAAGATAIPAPAEPLFNGRDEAGWSRYGHGIWTVEQGELVGRFDRAHPGPGYLFSKREFGDCRIRLEFWVSRGGNSGVYVRQPLRAFGPAGDVRPAHSPGDGVEVQIDYNDPKNLTGAVYNRKNCLKVAGGEDRWNTYDIECKGDRIAVRLNGELVNDYAPVPLRGALGFQIHGGKPHDHVVRFRRIELT